MHVTPPPPEHPRSAAPGAAGFPSAGTVARAGLAGALAVLACIAWLDAPLAVWVHHSGLPAHRLLLDLTYLPEIYAACAALVLLLTPLRLAMRGARRRAERVLLAMSVSLALASLLKEVLKVVFGRAWPETWIGGNLSLIQNHYYAFRWFQFSHAYQSFPSGHTSLAFGAMSVLWLACPRLRWLAAAACLLPAAGLLGMDYHFLGDLLAGALLGSACGVYVWGAARGLEDRRA
jgi:membrane-associated phospholipid phosphatase